MTTAAPGDSLRSPGAETAYLFRHALLRDAAYQLQMPADRARLHEVAVVAIEHVHGGRSPAAAPLEEAGAPAPRPHPSDAVAAELARHAGLAGLRDLEKHYLRQAAEAAVRDDRHGEARAHWMNLAGGCRDAERAEALLRAGDAANHSGHPAEALPLVTEALGFFRAKGLRSREGKALSELGGIHIGLADLAAAERVILESISILRESGESRQLATALFHLGTVAQDRGRVAEAEAVYREALAVAAPLDEPRLDGILTCSLGDLCGNTGRKPEAIALLSRAVDLLKRAGERRYLPYAMETLATCRFRDGDDARLAALESSLALHREIGNRRSEGITLGNIATQQGYRGRRAEAEALFRQALAIQREIGNRRSEALVLGNLAILLSDAGRLDEAEAAFDEALRLHTSIGFARGHASQLCARASLRIAQGRLEEARSDFRDGLAALRKLGDTAQCERLIAATAQACSKHGVPAFEEDPA